MNIMNPMNLFTPLLGLRGKKNGFFLFLGVLRAVLCSFPFIWFINSDMRSAGTPRGANSMNIL